MYGCDSASLPADAGLSVNKAGGCTVTFKKRGGVDAAWALAKAVAKWP